MKKKIIGICICMLLIATALSVQAGWSEKTKLVASDGAANDRFGSAVDLDDNDAIVGAYFDDISGASNVGSAYVFTYSGAWSQQAKLTASDYAADDQFGTSIAISGDYAIVGAPFDDDSGTSSGSAYIFVRSGASWSQQAKIVAADAAAGDEFGISVDIDGNFAIVGAPGKSSNQGFAYVFVRSGSSWSQKGKLGATSSSHLGCSVSISEDTVVMGAYGTNSNTGAAHIYQFYNDSWWLKSKLTASDGGVSDMFGTSVSIDGDYVICGAPGYDISVADEGAAYIFEKPVGGWVDMTETKKITASDASSSDNFGMHVAICGYYTVISSPDDDDNGTASGSAYIFEKSTDWTQKVKLTASDGASQDYFGWSVSIIDNRVLVGAYTDDNSNGVDAGSAYVFDFINSPPTIPVITGPPNGKINTPYNYTFVSTDPDSDTLYYFVDWGDNTNTGWLGPFVSGYVLNGTHTWTNKGTYNIHCKAKDPYGAESEGTLSVTMPLSYEPPLHPFLLWLFNRFPHAFPILRNLLGY